MVFAVKPVMFFEKTPVPVPFVSLVTSVSPIFGLVSVVDYQIPLSVTSLSP